MDDPHIIDESAMQRLHRIGGDELVNELISIFLKNTPARLATLLEGTNSGAVNQVVLAAHSLKSSCANLGAQSMRLLAMEIEKTALEGNLAPLPELIRKLEAEYQQTRQALEDRRGHLPHRPCIAIMEDNADNRLLVRVILESLYEILEYEGGAQALDDFQTRRPDLILLDISLPEIDGFAVLKTLRANPTLASLPVIALTAHAMTGDRSRILAAGFDDYIAKPLDDETVLIHSISRLLNR